MPKKPIKKSLGKLPKSDPFYEYEEVTTILTCLDYLASSTREDGLTYVTDALDTTRQTLKKHSDKLFYKIIGTLDKDGQEFVQSFFQIDDPKAKKLLIRKTQSASRH